MDKTRYRIGKTHISITSPEHTIKRIEDIVKIGITTYVCISDFRSVCYASDNSDYNEIVEASYLNTPDGMPLVWMARLWGIRDVHRTMGPKLFVNMLKKTNNRLQHFLIGDTDEVLAKIKDEYQSKFGSLIVGTYSPPFVDVEEFDYVSIANTINLSKADIVWVSMTAPKQDFFSTYISPLLTKKVLIGVGAAFRYSIGEYTIPGDFAQKIGLTGFFMRKKSWWQLKWYIKHVFRLIIFSVQIVARRVAGKKYYE